MQFCQQLDIKLKKIKALRSLFCLFVFVCSSALAQAEDADLLFSASEQRHKTNTLFKEISQVNLKYNQVQGADYQKEVTILDEVSQRYSKHLQNVYNLTPIRASEIVSAALLSSKEYNIDPSLIFAVIKVESRFDKNVNAGFGLGLMQIVSKAHPEKIARIGGRAKLAEINNNVNVGTEILAEYLIKAKGSVPRALQYYNGTANDPNKTYSRKVLTAQKEFIKVLEL